MNKVGLIGASGLIGSHLLNHLINDDHFESIRLISRRPLFSNPNTSVQVPENTEEYPGGQAIDDQAVQKKNDTFSHPKVEVVIIDFDDLTAFEAALKGLSIVFCSVGTTRRKDPRPETYRKVDYDIPVNAARLAKKQNCEKFLLISSVGADSHSTNFYLKLKGEVEEIVRELQLPQVSIFRPSLLLGTRDEFRLGERLAQVLLPLFSWVIPSNYQPIEASEVAQAMIWEAKQSKHGFEILHYDDMKMAQKIE